MHLFIGLGRILCNKIFNRAGDCPVLFLTAWNFSRQARDKECNLQGKLFPTSRAAGWDGKPRLPPLPGTICHAYRCANNQFGAQPRRMTSAASSTSASIVAAGTRMAGAFSAASNT